MKRAKSWMAWLAAAGLAAAAAAEEITARQAGTAARNWVERGYAMGKLPPGRTVAGVDDLADPVTGAQLHVVRFEGGGFVVTSGDDLVEPVIAFSETGDTVDLDERNPFWALLRADISAREAAVGIDRNAAAPRPAARVAKAAADAEQQPSVARRRWAELLDTSDEKGQDPQQRATKGNGRPSLLESEVRVDAFVQSRWNQGDVNGKHCFNFYTPGFCVCGCSATGIGQIMRYWEYPAGTVVRLTRTNLVNGVSTVVSMIEDDPAVNDTYDWANMPLVPFEEPDLTTNQCAAIGKLLYDIGVAIGMSWHTNGSAGSFSGGAASALRDVFHYANASTAGCSSWANGDLQNALIPNLDARCPVGLGVYQTSTVGRVHGGHAVVADGYGFSDGDFFVHINCGWGGGSDAWYCPPASDSSGLINNYNSIFTLLYNVHPHEKGNILSGRVLDAQGNPVENASVSLWSERQGLSSTTTDSNGIYAFFTDKTGPLTVEAAHDDLLGLATVEFGMPTGIPRNVTNCWCRDIVLQVPQAARPVVNVTLVDGNTTNGVVGVQYGAALPPLPFPMPSRTGFAFGGYYSTPETGGTQYYNAQGESSLKWDQPADTTLHACWIDPADEEWQYRIENGKAVVTNALDKGKEEYTIPEKLGRFWVGGIGDEAFQRCIGLREVSIPDSVTHIGAAAFQYCSGLTNITIPANVTRIGAGAFGACQNLKQITVADGNPCFTSEDGILFSKDKTSLVCVPGSKSGQYVIPDSVETVSGSAFFGCSGLTAVNIPDSVSSIGYLAFYGCGNLTSVTIPDSVVEFDDAVFWSCAGLTELEVPGEWWGTDNVGRSALPKGCTVVYRGIEPLEVANAVLREGVAGREYRTVLEATGGICPYTWKGAAANGLPAWLELAESGALKGTPPAAGDYAFSVLLTDSKNVETTANLTLHVGSEGEGAWLPGDFVTLDSQRGVSPQSVVVAIQGQAMPTVRVPVKTGFAFCGYFSGQKGTGTQYYTAEGTSARNWDGTENAILYAKWEADIPLPDALDNALLPFFYEEDETPWIGQTEETHDGVDAAQCGNPWPNKNNNEFSALKTTVDKPGRLSFWWKAEGNGNLYFHFMVDGRDQKLIFQTNRFWEAWSWNCADTNQHTVAWRLDRYGSTLATGWVDEVTWTPGCIVTLDPRNGGSSTPSVLAIPGEAMPATEVPTRTGCTFLGYYSGMDGTGLQYYTAEGTGARNWDGAAGTTATLYAGWKANTYNISLDRQGGAGGTTGLMAEYGMVLSSVRIPTREGYDFVGYYAGPGGTGAKYCNSIGKGIREWDVAENTTLFAHWMENVEVVWGYRIENGKAIVTNATPAQGKLCIPDQLGGCPVSGVDSGAFAVATNLLSMAMPSSVTSIGHGAFSDCNELESVMIPNGVTSIEGLVFWNCGNLSSVSIPASVTTISRPFGTCYGMTQIEVDPGNASFSSEDGVLFSKDKTSLLLCPGGKSGTYSVPDSVTNIAGYAFFACSALTEIRIPNSVVAIGNSAFVYCYNLKRLEFPGAWYSERDNLARLEFPQTCDVVYRQTVVFKSNDGTNGEKRETKAIGRVYGPLPEVTWTGHAFLGWFTEAAGGTEITETDTVTEESTRTLYAHWTSKQVTTFQGLEGTPETQITTNTIGKAFGTLPTVSKEGHSFLGWFTSASEGTEITASSFVPEMATWTLYAHWEALRYTVTFDRNAGTGGTAGVTATYGAMLDAVEIPVRKGYAFCGYFAKPDGGGMQYYGADGKGMWAWDQAEDATLYAKWDLAEVPLGEALDNAALAFVSEGDGVWRGQTVESHDGADAAWCANPTRATDGYACAVLGTTVQGPGRLSFWWRADGDGGAFTFHVDGKKEGTRHGKYRSWEDMSRDFSDAECHAVSWQVGRSYYDADGYSVTGWVDEVTWTPGCIVTLDPRNGDTNRSTVLGIQGEALPAVEVPERTGYVFRGYYGAPGGRGTRYYFPTGSNDMAWDQAKNATLYAKWTPQGTAEVPTEWLEETAAAFLAECGGDCEAAATAAAANGRPVWECYVAGLDPCNAEAKLEITEESFGFDKDGVLKLSMVVPPGRVGEVKCIEVSAGGKWNGVATFSNNGPDTVTYSYTIPDGEKAAGKFYRVSLKMIE